MSFFARNKKTAKEYLEQVSYRENVNWHSPKLASEQIPHIMGWKTWEYKKSKRKRR